MQVTGVVPKVSGTARQIHFTSMAPKITGVAQKIKDKRGTIRFHLSDLEKSNSHFEGFISYRRRVVSSVTITL